MAYDPGLTIHGRFERQAARQPDAIAVQHRDHSITYGALAGRARRWAAHLRGQGVVPGDLVGIRLDRTPDMVAAMLGVLMAGAGYVPLDPSYPKEHLSYMTEDAGLAAVISEPSTTDGGRFRPVPVTTAQVAYVLYTSGSTGSPKGVPMTHANAVDMLSWAADVFGDDLRRVLASTSICFDCSILEIFAPLAYGGTTVLVDSVMDVSARPDGYGVRLLHSVPSVITELLRTDRLPQTVRTAIVGGEALWAGLVEQIYTRSSIERLVNLYGPTEFTSYATMAVIGAVSAGTPPIGLPVANTRIHLLDSAGNPVPHDEPGEMFIAGAGLALGYLGRPALTAERFVPEPSGGSPGERMYRTGDLGAWGADGNLHFLGRIDDQVKVRGVRIEPTEVEHALLSHPAVREAVVSTVGTQPGAVELVAYLVSEADEAEIRAYLRDRVPSPLVPSHHVFLRQLPRLPNGKIDRRRLPAPGPVEVACASAAPPRSELEALLAALWADAAGIGEVDVHADLFTLGGHSLPALRVRARASEALGVDLPLRLFFEKHTIADLAAEVERLTAVRVPDDTPRAEPVSRDELSATQLAILRRADRGDAGLVLSLIVRLTGRLHPAALRWATATLVRRHEVLRSVVGTPARWEPATPPNLSFVDGWTIFVPQPWDVRCEPPVRFFVARIAGDDHVFGVVLHAIAADAWTVETVGHQILELYAAAIAGQPGPAFQTVQYADWAAQRKALRNSQAGQAQRHHWEAVLRDAPTLALPGAAGRTDPPGPSHLHTFWFGDATVQGLIRLAREESATPYMAAVTVFAAALHTTTGQPETMIGCPTSGRLTPELTTVVGPCMDALVLRCDASGEPTFRELLRRVRAGALAAYANDAVPFVEMAAGLPEDPRRHPVFQASVVLQQRPSLLDPNYSAELMARQDIGDIQTSGVTDEPPMTALDVELALFERDGDWEGVLTCRGDVITAEQVRALAETLRELASTAADAPDSPIKRA
uniref:Long-chain-fatty-acid--CoA ligase n=1 Tax=uncultured bacterium esnapd14 TaxID=1366594 RepID=S5TL70_9BACT|nr:long-chain-fatty-acid--CoA ligase [uncultured bacterium esnapd14]